MKNVVPNVIAVVLYVHSLKGMTGNGATFHSTIMNAIAVMIPIVRSTITVGEDQV